MNELKIFYKGLSSSSPESKILLHFHQAVIPLPKFRDTRSIRVTVVGNLHSFDTKTLN